MQHKICMVTGATSGMGKATAAALAQLGATVILVARDQRKGEVVRDEIRTQSGNPQVDVLYADLASQQAIRDLAATFKQRYQHLHVLVNNAGGLFFRRETTVDGLEMTFAVDHLAYFLLTNLLLDVLTASVPARIINVSSNAERIGKIAFDDLQRKRRYSAFPAYAQAKLGNLLFTYELARRLAGTGVTVNAVTPGPVATSFGSGGRGLRKIVPLVFRVIGIRAEEGAQTAIDLASSPALEGVTGKVFYHSKELQSSPQSRDVALQQRLWQVSETLTGLPVTTAQQL
ncbi:MAG: SDR family oxidoreductase [Roseiflexaceae bacterium]|nr:SDR family oxidoreductase [Roseiflexaceae bacterium]